MTTKELNEACATLLNAVKDTGMEVNFSGESGEVTIYWNGVNRLDCGAGTAAKAITLIKQLETFGMKDC